MRQIFPTLFYLSMLYTPMESATNNSKRSRTKQNRAHLNGTKEHAVGSRQSQATKCHTMTMGYIALACVVDMFGFYSGVLV